MRAFLCIIALLAQIAATSAPGDRYFGQLKMSALRIRYETMQLRKRYETRQLLPEDTEHLLRFTEDAFRDWARQYPHDPWLPSTGYLIAQLYEALPGVGARSSAIAMLSYVKASFPASPYGRKARDQLHRGVPIRPYPQWARAMHTPAPTKPPPTPVMPAVTPASGAGPSAAASPMPSPVPSG